MLRKLLGSGLLLATLAGCTKLAGTHCDTDDQCKAEGGLCDTGLHRCYTVPEVTECTLSCAAYEACTATECKPRFTELKILAPTANALVAGGGPVEVQAKLTADPAYVNTTTYPDTLTFTATRSDGAGATGSFGSVTRNGDTYTVQWTPPSGQTQVTLTAAHPIPAAVQSASVTVQLDTQAPTFTISFSSPPTRASGSVATQADQRDPTPGYDTAFRRDESVTVTVSADEPVTDATLTVIGIGPGGSAGQAQGPVTLAAATTCGGSPPFCGTATVNLSVPEMRDVRGSMGFRVDGKDAANNQGSANAGLKVTRWKWVFDTGGGIFGSPAVGNWGTIYVGTNQNNNQGTMLAVFPDGARKWQASTGDVTGDVAVGAPVGNEEYVYVAGRTASGSFLYALLGSTGTEKQKCQYANANLLQGSLAVGSITLTADTAETAAGIYESSGAQTRIAGIRPDGATKCLDISNPANQIPISVTGGAFVMKDQNIFYGTTTATPGARVTSYDLALGSNTPRLGWPLSTGQATRGLAVSGDKLYGAAGNSDDSSLGSLFSVSTTSATPSTTKIYPASGTSRVFNLAIGNGDVAYFGGETATTSDLFAMTLSDGQVVKTPSGVLRGAPVIGKNNRLYTVDTDSTLTVWTRSTLAELWHTNLSENLTAKDVSPTVDCQRDASGNAVAGLGTLYVAGDKKLYALITDDAGMDASAPWPKFQRDARNTGNPATPITSCP